MGSEQTRSEKGRRVSGVGGLWVIGCRGSHQGAQASVQATEDAAGAGRAMAGGCGNGANGAAPCSAAPAGSAMRKWRTLRLGGTAEGVEELDKACMVQPFR